MRLRKQLPAAPTAPNFAGSYHMLESPGGSPPYTNNKRKSVLNLKCVIVVVAAAIISTAAYLVIFRRPAKVDETPPAIVPTNYAPGTLRPWESPIAATHGRPDGPGEMGRPVVIPEDKEEMLEKFKEHEFNVMASDMISLNRTLADNRPAKCILRQYQDHMPTASIVIVFHNEAWSTLLRTIWSLITQSPRSLLQEIILVDDASEKEHLGALLDDYVARLPVNTVVVRTGNRTGLIRARLLGVERATGQVIVFLDAHCECNQGWLPPLLSRIVENRQTVASPIIDVISDETFEYKKVTDGYYGGFDSRLSFKWDPIPKSLQHSDPSEPIPTPTIAGGLFAMDREYFYELGSYDEGMEIWGAENLEMSFRVWMCGGVLEMVPCSRVGHVFRKKTPYSFIGESAAIIRHNTARLAEVWLDEFKGYYLMGHKDLDFGDVSSRHALRKSLKCRSFRWYLDNIYPQGPYLKDFQMLGYIQSAAAQEICLDSMGTEEGAAGTFHCHRSGGNQLFTYGASNQLMVHQLCLDVEAADGVVPVFKSCVEGKRTQKWLHNKDRLLKSLPLGRCLALGDDEKSLLFEECDGTALRHQWQMG